MQNKKPIIIISILCVIALALGYWYGMPKEGSGHGEGNISDDSKGPSTTSLPPTKTSVPHPQKMIFRMQSSVPTDLAWYRDSKKIVAAGNGSNELCVWDLQESKIIMSKEGFGQSVAIGPPPHNLLYTFTKKGELVALHPVTGETSLRLLQFQEPRRLRISSDYKWLAVSTRRTMFLYDLNKIGTTPATSMKMHRPAWIERFGFSPDGTRLAITHQYIGRFECWDLRQLKVAYSKVIGKHLGCSHFSPDGRFLITPSIPTGVIHVLKVESGEEIGKLIGHAGGVSSVDFTKNGHYMVSCGDIYSQGKKSDGTIRIWDFKKGVQLKSWKANQTRGTLIVKISPNEKLLASCSRDGTVKVWGWNPRN
ncbi:MAG: hypothetical protein QF406_12125 [Verrucomicrobiota bacterium]|jgi:WD40 repeat protein|nr:hypothetical protein [Verrucomicrobiota bacterium]